MADNELENVNNSFEGKVKCKMEGKVKDNIKGKVTCTVKCGVIMIAVLIAAILVAYYYPGLPDSQPEREGKLAKSVDAMRKKFPLQLSRTWTIIQAALRPQFDGSSPRYPAAILLAGNATARTPACLANHMGQTLDKLRPSKLSGCPKLELKNQDKAVINQVAVKYQEDVRCVQLVGLETVDSMTAKMLHGLCDGDTAPYKDTVMFMSLGMDESSPLPPVHNEDKHLARLDSLVRKRLMQLWSADLTEDIVDALWARIGNHVVIIREESDHTLTALQCL